MHSLLPHQHHDEIDADVHAVQHANADGLIDYLRLVFHIDLGDGHMESFEKGNNFDFDIVCVSTQNLDLASFPFYVSLLTTSQQISTKSNFTHTIPILQNRVLSHLDFRGPPTTV